MVFYITCKNYSNLARHVAILPAHRWVQCLLSWYLFGARRMGRPRPTWLSKTSCVLQVRKSGIVERSGWNVVFRKWKENVDIVRPPLGRIGRPNCIFFPGSKHVTYRSRLANNTLAKEKWRCFKNYETSAKIRCGATVLDLYSMLCPYHRKCYQGRPVWRSCCLLGFAVLFKGLLQ